MQGLFAGHLDFNSCSAQSNSADGNKARHADLSTNQLVTPLLGTARDTNTSSCTTVSKSTDNKITIDKNQLTRLLEIAISHTKAEQKKEQKEKKEAEMRLAFYNKELYYSSNSCIVLRERQKEKRRKKNYAFNQKRFDMSIKHNCNIMHV